MLSFECRSRFLLVGSTIFGALLLIISTTLTAITIYYFCVIKNDNTKPTIKYLCIFAQLTCCLSIISLSGLGLVRQDCEFSNETVLYKITNSTAVSFYATTITLLYIIFAYRVQSAFKNSLFELSFTLTITLKVFGVLFIVTNIGCIVGFFIYVSLGIALLSFQTVKLNSNIMH